MANSKPAIKSGSTPGMPRWLAKTHSRYDADDIAFSPPSDDGAPFFSLHYGQSESDGSYPSSSSPHQSTFDRINEELGLADVYKQVTGDRRPSITGGLSSRGSGLCLRAELQKHLHEERIEKIAKNQRSVKPFVAVPSPLTRASTDPLQQPSDGDNEVEISSSDSEYNETNEVLCIKDHITEISTNLPQIDNGKVSLIQKVKNFVFSSSDETKLSSEQNITEYQSTGGVLVERRMPFYNSFFYVSENSATAGDAQVALQSTATTAVATATITASQDSITASGVVTSSATTEAAPVVIKARRPKPSRLREMNFWAPTSM